MISIELTRQLLHLKLFYFLSGLFLTFGCSGIVPGIHFIVAYGVTLAHRQASVGWMALMGALYIIGAIMYATRVPERFFPGKCDIWVSILKYNFTSALIFNQCFSQVNYTYKIMSKRHNNSLTFLSC